MCPASFWLLRHACLPTKRAFTPRLLRAQVARSTEGMLLSSQFPVNYFALGQVEQWYGDEFREEFARVTGESWDSGTGPAACCGAWGWEDLNTVG